MSGDNFAFIDYGVTKDCANPDSYGMICVQCNQCGRFTRKESVVQEQEAADGKDAEVHDE